MTTPKPKTRNPWKWMWIAIAALWLGCAIFSIITCLPQNAADSFDSGKFGDTFGALNTLFTGLAFGGLLLTLQHSKKEAADNQRAYDQEKQRHEETIRKMAEQTEATLQSTKVLALSAKITAINGEVQILNEQIQSEAVNPSGFGEARLKKERRILMAKLKVLQDVLSIYSSPRDTTPPPPQNTPETLLPS